MRFTKSIRWRLLLWITFFLTLILAGLDFAACRIYFNNSVAQLDEELRRRVSVISESVFAPVHPTVRNMSGAAGLRGNVPLDGELQPPGDITASNNVEVSDRPAIDIPQITAAARRLGQTGWEGFYYAVWSRRFSPPVKESANRPGEIPRPLLEARDTATYGRTRDGLREMYHATERGDCILVGRTLSAEYADEYSFAGWMGLGSLVVLAFGVGGAWIIIGRALRPVKKISSAARHISDGNLSERINSEETESELGQLAGVLNSTFTRLETSFAQQKRFTADAAHELRTPISVLISEAQTTLARERPSGEYRETIAICLEAAQQMRHLTDSLLELARYDGGQEKMCHDQIDLAALVRGAVKFIQPLAAERGLQVHCDLAEAWFFGDTEKLNRMMNNLLTNAVRYNRENGEIRVTARVDDDFVIISVSDTGVGIAQADLARIFERFYRVDKARSNGGNGLGLAICKAVVDAHGGNIEVKSQVNIGTTFTIRLPY